MPFLVILIAIAVGLTASGASFWAIHKAARRPANGEKYDLLLADEHCRKLIGIANMIKFNAARQVVPK